MQATLTDDVIKHVLRRYAGDYAPMWHLACRRWRNIHHEEVPEKETNNASCGVVQLAKEGRLELLTFLRTNRLSSCSFRDFSREKKNDMLIAAARGGHVELVALLYEEWQAGMLPNLEHNMAYQPMLDAIWEAASQGHIPVIRKCIEYLQLYSDNEFSVMNAAADAAISAAARAGREQLVQLCMDEWDARDIRSIMTEAAIGGHEHIMRRCKEEWKDPSDYFSLEERGMAAAAYGGHERLVRLCHDEWGARNIDWTMLMAAHGGQLHIMRLCREEWGATPNLDQAMQYAAERGHEDAMRLCREWGATDVSRALRAAATHPHIIALCNEWLAEQAV